jgi:hypothetical protein
LRRPDVVKRLFADIERRPRQYGLHGSFVQAVAFINGCGAGKDWGLLVGFKEWLALRAGTEADLTWWALVCRLSESEAGGDVTTLFRLIDAFPEQWSGAHGATLIITKYATRARNPAS